MISFNKKEEIKLELKLPCNPKVLKYIRKLIDEIALDTGFSEEEVSYIEMCVDEACTNVIKHAYPSSKLSFTVPLKIESQKPEMNIFVCVFPDKIHISVIDYGVGVKKNTKDIRNLDEYLQKGRHSGLGIFMIKKFMDEVHFSSPEGSGTIIDMIKYKKE